MTTTTDERARALTWPVSAGVLVWRGEDGELATDEDGGLVYLTCHQGGPVQPEPRPTVQAPRSIGQPRRADIGLGGWVFLLALVGSAAYTWARLLMAALRVVGGG